MKLAQIITEALSDINARIDVANLIRRDIAAGQLSMAQISRKYRISKSRVTVIRKRMMVAGWIPGQPLPDNLLTKPRTPSQAPPPKYPGLSGGALKHAMWQDPEYRAKVMAARQAPEYREQQSQSMTNWWEGQPVEVRQDRTAAAHDRNTKKPPETV